MVKLLWSKNSKKQSKSDGETEEERDMFWTSVAKALFVVTAFLLYVAAGALVLPIWEDLNTLDAIYFSFVSLTTIGFGDIGKQTLDLHAVSGQLE